MKILIISTNQFTNYNWGHELFRRAFSIDNDTTYFGAGYSEPGLSLKKFLKSKKINIRDFDFVFTHGLKYTKNIKDIYDIPKDIIKVHYVVDYFQSKDDFVGKDKDQHKFLNKYKPDIIFSVYQNSIKPIYKNIKCDNVFCLPFSVCTDTYTYTNTIKKNQVVACFSKRLDVYPDRIFALKLLNRKKINIIDYKIRYDYIKTINNSKIILGVNDIYQSLNMRITEILACGGFLLTNKPKYIESLGLKKDIHYKEYTSFDEMIDMIYYYYKYNDERKNIEEKGMYLVRKKHSCRKRIQEMIEIIKQVKL